MQPWMMHLFNQFYLQLHHFSLPYHHLATVVDLSSCVCQPTISFKVREDIASLSKTNVATPPSSSMEEREGVQAASTSPTPTTPLETLLHQHLCGCLVFLQVGMQFLIILSLRKAHSIWMPREYLHYASSNSTSRCASRKPNDLCVI